MKELLESLNLIIMVVTVSVNTLLAWKVYSHQRNSATNILYGIMAITLSLWIIAIYFSAELTNTAASAIFWAKASVFVATPLTLCFFLFAHTAPSRTLYLSKRWFYLSIIATALVMIFSFSPYTFPFAIETNGIYKAVPGPGMSMFGILSTIFSVLAISILMKKMMKAKGPLRKQYQYIFGGLFLMSGLSILTIFIPVFFYSNNSFVILGPFYSLIFMGMTAYAIIHHRFFELKIIATEIFVVLLSVFFLARLFLVVDFKNFIIELLFFLATVFFGYLLTRSVANEVKQRNLLSELNKELGSTNERLEELLQMKTEFMGIASHQLRTPLTVLRGLLDMQYNGDFNDLPKERVRDLQGNMLKSAVRLTALINDLMDSTKLEGGITLDIHPVDIDSLIHKIGEELEENFKKKGLTFSIECEDQPTNIEADPKYLHEALVNIIDNAEKYTAKGSVTVSIHRLASNEIQIVVEDTGIGLSEDDKDKLFEKFSRGSRSQSVYTEGTGLGLHIVKRIIEAHGGTIHLESSGINEGTRAIILLPVKHPKKKMTEQEQ